MIDRIVQFSIKWRLFVVLVSIAVAGAGLYSATLLAGRVSPPIALRLKGRTRGEKRKSRHSNEFKKR